MIKLTEIAAMVKKPMPVLICENCGAWFSVCLWGKNTDGEPTEVPLIHPRFCSVCGGANLFNHADVS